MKKILAVITITTALAGFIPATVYADLECGSSFDNYATFNSVQSASSCLTNNPAAPNPILYDTSTNTYTSLDGKVVSKPTGVYTCTYTNDLSGGTGPQTSTVYNPADCPSGGVVQNQSGQIVNQQQTSAPAATPAAAPAATPANTSNGNLGYTPLEPIQGITSGANGSAPDFPTLLDNLFNVLITIGALIAVLSLTIGGVQYMVSEALPNKKRGLDRARAALWGMLLVAGAWLILHTINPQLLNFTLNPCPSGNCSITPSSGNPNTGTPANGSIVTLSSDQQAQTGLGPIDSQALVTNNGETSAVDQIQSFNNQCMQHAGVMLASNLGTAGGANQTVWVCQHTAGTAYACNTPGCSAAAI